MDKVYLKLSKKIVDGLVSKVKLSDCEKEILTYQIRIYISNVVQLLIMLAVSIPFNVTITLIISYITMRLSRSVLGGIHHRTYLMCSIHTYLFFIIAVIGSHYLVISRLAVYFGLFLLEDVLIAPIISEKRGVYGKKSRLRMKLLSLLCLGICLIMCIKLETYSSIILITLIMVHLELLVAKIRERRGLCCIGCVEPL